MIKTSLIYLGQRESGHLYGELSVSKDGQASIERRLTFSSKFRTQDMIGSMFDVETKDRRSWRAPQMTIERQKELIDLRGQMSAQLKDAETQHRITLELKKIERDTRKGVEGGLVESVRTIKASARNLSPRKKIALINYITNQIWMS